MERLSFTETVHSKSNRLLWRLRSAMKFRRNAYAETGCPDLLVNGDAQELETHYRMGALRKFLNAETYLKNLYTLSVLEEMLLFLEEHGPEIDVLEPGSQDFARLPAMRLFFEAHGIQPKITALELDPYPVLNGLHSRADKAEYYRNILRPTADTYHAADFFLWRAKADCVLAFYPFVSPHPALAWGIPAEFGDAELWVESFVRTLRPNGLLLVVHQGEWEEREFDEARRDRPLQLLSRSQVAADFYPLPHPACVSIYRKK